MNKHTLLTYALNFEKKLVHIDSVSNGLSCNCICPGCKEVLVAKNGGEKKEHHFAHKTNKDCPSGNQTAVHLLAKEIIQEENKIPFVNNKGEIVFVNPDVLQLEKNLGDIIPDIYAEFENKPIAIEILVTHEVDQTKYLKIEKHELSTIEINLSEVEQIEKEVIRNAIYEQKNMKIIYDSLIMHNLLNQKKQVLLQKGIKKTEINGVVKQCPMSCLIINGRLAKFRDVRRSFCEKCFLSYISEQGILCVGHINGKIPLWLLQANLNENRFMTIEETTEQFKTFKDRIGKNSI